MKPGNDNDEPIIQARKLLASLGRDRQRLMREDVRQLSPERCRQREEAMRHVIEAEAALRAVLPLA